MYPFSSDHIVEDNMYYNLVHVLLLLYYDQVGCTPLHRAASTGKSELCELLIEEGAEVDAVDRAGQTPLMNAVICYNKEVCLFYVCTRMHVSYIRAKVHHTQCFCLQNSYLPVY